MNYIDNLFGAVESKTKEMAAQAAAQAALQEEIQRINLAKTKTISVDKMADTDERPFEKMEIDPEEQKEYDIESYQAEQRILEEAAEKGLPPPTFGRPTPAPGEEPSQAVPIAAFGKKKLKKLVKKLKKIIKPVKKKKKTVKKKKKTVKKKKKTVKKKKKTSFKKVAKKTIKDTKKTFKKIGKEFDKIGKDIQDIVTFGKRRRSFGRSATLPPMEKGVYSVQGYDPHALLMQSLFGKKRKFGKGCDSHKYKFGGTEDGCGCYKGKTHFGNVSPRDPMYRPQKKLSYGKRKRKRKVKRKRKRKVKRKRKRKVKRKRKRKVKRKRKRRVKKRKFGKKVSKKPSAVLRRLCKRLKVRLTVKRGKKRVYKSEKVLKKQCKNKMKKRKK